MHHGRLSERSLAVVLLCALLALGCGSSVEPGVSLKLESAPALVPPELTTDLGYTVSLDQLAWTVARVEIEPCPSALRTLEDFLVPNAVAHTGSSPTLSGEPIVASLLDPHSVTLATLHPPAAHYCTLHVTIGPADADAKGLAGERDMLGYSLRARGTYATGDGAARAFALASTRSLESVTLEIAVDLSRAGSSVTLALGESAAHWFDGVDFEAGDASAAELAVAEKVRDSLSVVAR